MSGFFVSDEYRTNPMSLVPGGSVVKVTYADGSFRLYDKIKKPYHYIRVITEKDNKIISVEVDNTLAWKK